MALNSKRMQTFFNEFLITTTTFINNFASDCENKFETLERKLYKIESNLTIIEAKVSHLDSILNSHIAYDKLVLACFSALRRHPIF